MKTHTLLFAALASSVVILGCHSGPEPTTAQTAATDLRTDDARLQGTWKLVAYTPDVPLEPIFAMLLHSQLNVMSIRFENGHMFAQSPTIDLVRAYHLDNATGPRFQLLADDATGISYVSTCEYSSDGNTLSFHGDTDPWRGSGTLTRVSP